MLKTNTNKFKLNFKNEVLNYINDDLKNASTDQKIDFLIKDIKNNVNHKYNMRRIPNHVERLADYLSGLPYYFLEAYYQPIIEQAERLVEGKFPEKKRAKIVENYFNFMALHLVKLIEKEKNDDYLSLTLA